MPSAPSSPRSPKRLSSSAIECAAISYDIHTSGRGRLALGRAHISSTITGKSEASASPCSTSGIRTSPRPSKAYQERDAEEFESIRGAGSRTGAARRFS